LQRTLGNLVKFTPVVAEEDLLELSFSEAAQRVQNQYLETLRYENCSMSDLCVSHGLAIRVLYTYEGRVIEGDFNIEDSDARHYTESEDHPLCFFVNKTMDGHYLLTVQYDQSVYNHHDMHKLGEAWMMVATQGISSSCAVSHISIVTSQEREHLLYLGDGSRRNTKDLSKYSLIPEERTIVANFFLAAQRELDKPILYDDKGYYTIGELDKLSNRVAHWIVSHSIAQNSIIGIQMPRCRQYMAAALGALKAGCGIVTIDEDIPEERKSYIMKDADIKALIDLQQLEIILGEEQNDSPIDLCRIDGVFQIFFTSGTTGKPKGVVLTINQLTAGLNNAIMSDLLNEDDIHCVLVRFSFVACIANLWFPLGYGTCTYIITQEVFRNPETVANYINRNKITDLLLPASYGVNLVNNYDVSLRHLYIGAEKALPVTNRNVSVLNIYGCT